MIVTLINCKINTDEDKIYGSLDNVALSNLNINEYLHEKLLYYKFLTENILILICPMLKSKDGKKVVVWPSEKLPGRPYPVYVYLYAVAIYLTEDISMRKAAEKTRKKFKLVTFCHSTLSRTLKKLRQNILQYFTVFRSFLEINLCHLSLIQRRHWGDGQTKEYMKALEVIGPILIDGRELPFGTNLNYRFYNVTQKFII